MATRKLKVFGWLGYHGGKQVRKVMASTSMTAVINSFDHSKPSRAYMSETRNPEEVSAAMSDPGAVFFRPVNAFSGPFTKTTTKTN